MLQHQPDPVVWSAGMVLYQMKEYAPCVLSNQIDLLCYWPCHTSLDQMYICT